MVGDSAGIVRTVCAGTAWTDEHEPLAVLGQNMRAHGNRVCKDAYNLRSAKCLRETAGKDWKSHDLD